MNEFLSPDKGNILIVDDIPANLRLLSKMLTERGHKVRAVLSGPQALAAAQAAPPDLVLLDIRMPEMDGYEVCRQLMAHEQTRDIPILFISALDATADKVKAFTVGGVDYITKPFQAEEVLARVEKHLALRRMRCQLQAANTTLARQLTALEIRNEELDAFAHTVAHDIRNPLAIIMSYADLLAKEYDLMPSNERTESLHAVVQGVHKVVNIVDELLLLSQVRQIDVKLEQLDMGRIVTETQRRLVFLFKEYQAQLIAPASWPAVWGYGPWIEEVWVNYLSNGCKYGGRPPRLEVGWDARVGKPARQRREANDPQRSNAASYLRFWVRDNGDGLSPEAQARLFTPFTQLNQIHLKGHGLGLSIVRRIVEKLGGQVGVESAGQPGGGSLFYFTLPAEN